MVIGFVVNVLNSIREGNQENERLSLRIINGHSGIDFTLVGIDQMSWEIIVIVLIFVFTNVGQSYFTTWRVTSESFLKGIFNKDTPLKEIKDVTHTSWEDMAIMARSITDIKTQIDDLKAEIQLSKTLAKGGYEQIYSLLMRGPQVKIAELIEQEFERKSKELKKREEDAINLARKIEEYGKVILKNKG